MNKYQEKIWFIPKDQGVCGERLESNQIIDFFYSVEKKLRQISCFFLHFRKKYWNYKLGCMYVYTPQK